MLDFFFLDTSFESGVSEDYAIPPDALSQGDSSYMDTSIPTLPLRTPYTESPHKKIDSLEKVKQYNHCSVLLIHPCPKITVIKY